MGLILRTISMRSLKQQVPELNMKVVRKMKTDMETSDMTMTPDEDGKSPSILHIDVEQNDVDVIYEEKEDDAEKYENSENIAKDMVDMEDADGVLALMNKVKTNSTGVDLDAEGTEGDVENGLVIEMAELDEASKQVNISQPGLIEFQES